MQAHVWWADAGDGGTAVEAWLSGVERLRLAGFRRPEDRAVRRTGWALLRVVLAADLGCEPADVPVLRRCPNCGGEDHGPIAVPGRHVSLSHAGARVGIALAPGAVGLDLEQVGAIGDVSGLATTIRAPGEPLVTEPEPFTRMWVRKEAVLKATREGLPGGPDRIAVSPPDAPAALVAHHGRPGVRAALVDLRQPGPGYAGALALLAAERVEVCEHDGGLLL